LIRVDADYCEAGDPLASRTGEAGSGGPGDPGSLRAPVR
jgi:hypothetical protein